MSILDKWWASLIMGLFALYVSISLIIDNAKEIPGAGLARIINSAIESVAGRYGVIVFFIICSLYFIRKGIKTYKEQL